jgi:hypothetical protein
LIISVAGHRLLTFQGRKGSDAFKKLYMYQKIISQRRCIMMLYLECGKVHSMWHAAKADPISLHSNTLLPCTGYDPIDECVIIWHVIQYKRHNLQGTAFSIIPDLGGRPTTYPVLNPKACQGPPDCFSHIRSWVFPLQLTEVDKKFL